MARPELSPSADLAVCQIEELGKASGMLSKTQSPKVAAVCEAAKEMLLWKAKKLVADSLGLPLLSSKSCDGTPLRMKNYSSRTLLPEMKKQKYHGSRGVEVLVSNEFLRYRDPSEGWQTAVLLSEPVPLTKGKSADLVVAAARQAWRTLRPLGAAGCVVEHYVWDRAGIEALERHCRAWHAAQPPFVSSVHPPSLAQYMDFIVITPCALHDGQNGFRWAFLEQCKDRSMMRDLYIAVESLRNSSDLICTRMATWVASRLQFVEGRGEEWKTQQRELWMALDIESEMVELLVGELELCWNGEHLCVRAGAQVSFAL